MKKYLLPISITINVLLLLIITILAFSLFNLKDKVESVIANIKTGQYIEAIKEGSTTLLPNTTEKTNKDEEQCEHLYINIDLLINYLNEHPDIKNRTEYITQINKIKNNIEKTPIILRDTACKIGISGLNSMLDNLSTKN